MHRYEFQTIQQFVEGKKRSRASRWALLRIVALLLLILADPVYHMLKPKPSAPEPKFTLSPVKWKYDSTGSGFGEDYVNPVPLDAWRKPLKGAMKLWGAALPDRVWLPNPELKVGDWGQCTDQRSAIACADPLHNTISIYESNPETDRLTIMLHEYGHILGVPHIQGDPVMNAGYQKGSKVAALTPAAIALGRLAWKAGTIGEPEQ